MHELREATRAHVVTGPQGAASWRRRLLVSQLQVLSCWLCAPSGLRSRNLRLLACRRPAGSRLGVRCAGRIRRLAGGGSVSVSLRRGRVLGADVLRIGAAGAMLAEHRRLAVGGEGKRSAVTRGDYPRRR